MPTIFLSYRRDDSAYVTASISEKLCQRFGEANVFFDVDTIPLGTDFRDHIDQAVGRCDVLLAVIGDGWLHAKDGEGNRRLEIASDSVRLELESALQRRIPVIPVLVGNAMMPRESDLPASIQGLVYRNAAEVRPGRDLRQHLERLIAGIDSILKPSARVDEVSDSEKRGRVADSIPSADSLETKSMVELPSPDPHQPEPRSTRPRPRSLRLGRTLYLVLLGLSAAFLVFTIIFSVTFWDRPDSADYRIPKWVSICFYLSAATMLAVAHRKVERRRASFFASIASFLMAGWACLISQRIGFGEVSPAWIIATLGLGTLAWVSWKRLVRTNSKS